MKSVARLLLTSLVGTEDKQMAEEGPEEEKERPSLAESRTGGQCSALPTLISTVISLVTGRLTPSPTKSNGLCRTELAISELAANMAIE